MRYLIYSLWFFICSCQYGFDHEKNVIYLTGDSTMSEKLASKRPETGWGEKLNEFLIENIIIENHAKNGRSTKSFIREGRWKAVFEKLNQEDIVMIQFGHNDSSKSKKERYTTPSEYRKNLTRFVNDARFKKAIPVLLTPTVRRRFDAEGKFYDTHGPYPEIVRSVADSLDVFLIDHHKYSQILLEELGEEKTKAIFLWLEKGENENYPEGLIDNTHFSPMGARKMAEFVILALNESKLSLKKYLK